MNTRNEIKFQEEQLGTDAVQAIWFNCRHLVGLNRELSKFAQDTKYLWENDGNAQRIELITNKIKAVRSQLTKLSEHLPFAQFYIGYVMTSIDCECDPVFPTKKNYSSLDVIQWHPVEESC
jgi:hypothetical protein